MMNKDQVDVLKQRNRILHSKLEILDPSLRVVREITGFLREGSYAITNDSGSRRTCTIELHVGEDTIPSPNSAIWINKRFRAYVGIEHMLTGEVVWFPIGTFAITDPSQDITITAENQLSIKGVDFVAFMDGTLGGSLEVGVIVNPGDYIHNALKNIITEFTNFPMNIQNSEFTIPYKIELDPDEELWDLLEEILGLYLHYEGFFDVNGTFIFQKTSDLYTDAVVWDFSIPENNLINAISVDFNWDDVRNRVTVNGKDDDGFYPTYTVVALSSDPVWADCPYTVDNLGEVKAFDYTLDQVIVDQAWANVQSSTSSSPSLYEIKRLAQQNGWDKNTAIDKTIGEEVRQYCLGAFTAKELEARFEAYKLTGYFESLLNTARIDDARYNPRAIVISENDYYKVEQCITRAQYELDTRLSGSEKVRMSVVPIYGLDVNQLIYLNFTSEQNKQYGINTNITLEGKYCIDDINCELGEDGLMDITCHKVTKNRYAFDQGILHEKDPDSWQYQNEVQSSSTGVVTKQSRVALMAAGTEDDSSEGTEETYNIIYTINNIFDAEFVYRYGLTMGDQKDLRDLLKITKGYDYWLHLVDKGSRKILMLGDEELMRDENGIWYTATYSIGADLSYDAGGTVNGLPSYWDSHNVQIKLYPQVLSQLDTYLPSRVIVDYGLSEEEAKAISWVGACYGKRTATPFNFQWGETKNYLEVWMTNDGAVIKIAEDMNSFLPLQRDINKNWYSTATAYGQSLFENKGWVGDLSSLPLYEFDEEENGYLRLDYENTMAGRNDILA